MVIFLWILHRRLRGLPWQEWGVALLQLTAISLVAGISSWIINWGGERLLGRGNLLWELLELTLAITIGLIIFSLLAVRLKLPEVEILASRLQKKFRRDRKASN